jgi:hypothetical protein
MSMGSGAAWSDSACLLCKNLFSWDRIYFCGYFQQNGGKNCYNSGTAICYTSGQCTVAGGSGECEDPNGCPDEEDWGSRAPSERRLFASLAPDVNPPASCVIASTKQRWTPRVSAPDVRAAAGHAAVQQSIEPTATRR